MKDCNRTFVCETQTKAEKIVQVSYCIIGLLVFLYVLYRAIKIGVTYDEAWTINSFVPQNFINILNYSPCDANNHIINTLLIKLLFLFGNHSLFIARLPNVLAFIMYVVFSYKIASRYLSSLLGICLFLLLILNPFVLDFFSIARGYGLSLGFLMASLYYVISYFLNQQPTKIIFSLIFGAMAVLCNFSLLNYFLVLLIAINIVSYFFSKQYNFKQNLFFSFAVLISLIVTIYEPIRKLKANGNLYYGGDNNFYSDTLISLTKYTFYTSNTNIAIEYSLNTFIVVILISILLSFYYNRSLLTSKNLVLGITLLCILSVVVQHYLLGTLYLIDRTALFFYPLFILCLCFSLNEFSKKRISKIIAFVVVLSFGINFFRNTNFYKTAIWYFDAHSISILNELNEKGKVKNRKIKIDFSWPFQSSINYYVNNNKFPFIEIVKNKQDREELNTMAEYYIYLNQSLEKVGYDANSQKINSFTKDIFKQYKNEKIIIFNNLRK
jgi:hypothetical protein